MNKQRINKHKYIININEKKSKYIYIQKRNGNK